MNGRESRDVAAEIVSGIDVLGLTDPLKFGRTLMR